MAETGIAQHPARAALRTEHVFVIGEPLPVAAPQWLGDAVADFVAEVGGADYPCHFGSRAVRKGELFGTWADGPTDLRLAEALQDFLDATRPHPSARLVLAVFLPQEEQARTHEWYGERFWSVLEALHAADDRTSPAGYPTSPQDPRWEFTFGGEAMFVFAAAPTHRGRRSRRLGSGLVLLFQPRNVFNHIEGGTPGGRRARQQIRSRLLEWDTSAPHAAMGDYGDKSNFEWKQYFLSDDSAAVESTCPLDPHADDPLHALVSAQARRTPYAPAVVAGDEVIDYATLEQRSDLLARRLIRRGVQPDDRLAIVADHSVDTVVAVLATLKAGAAYVPIDPEYPEERRAYLLEDAGVDVVLTPRRLAASVPVGPRWLLLSDAEAGPPEQLTDPLPSVRPDNLAYVIYTSGSTGQPKGVAVAHRQIVASTRAQYAVERPPPEAFLMPISFSFDASAVGVFWTLTTGGCLVLPTHHQHRDPDALRELISRYGITHIDCTPTLWDLVLGTDPTPLMSMRCVQVGGEVCPASLVRRHLQDLPECVFENNYGPTETTIWSTTKLFSHADELSSKARESVPIGRPIPGARVHLLTAGLQPAPEGSEGELFIGGPGVTRGYLGRPAMTAEFFLPDPFSARAGSRMYRTGDLGRRRSDGELDFVGRADKQVKVRGFRIELGEIESTARTHGSVRDAAVVVETLATGEHVLVGYVHATDDLVSPDSLRRVLTAHLAARLPDHMVPRRWICVSEVPRTISGKLDSSRLSSYEHPAGPRPAARSRQDNACPVMAGPVSER